jgi:hypothetical protein
MNLYGHYLGLSIRWILGMGNNMNEEYSNIILNES